MWNIYLIPNWFFGYDVIFELIFALITLAVSIYSFKVYKLSEQRQAKLFGISFLFISISYFIQSFLNFAIISKLNENICKAIQIVDVMRLNNIGIFTFIIFFITGLITLTYMTLKVKDMRIYALLFIITILSLIFSSNRIYLFYFLASVLLINICIHYIITYLHTKQPRILLVLAAFILLLISTIHFTIAVNHVLFYALGHFFELIAYILILTNLILIVKNEKKTG